ncbi:MAG: hypothetical protein COA80_12915 [Leeuwenhoekiella sp.]|nr:MAG: hypothetical protein COA80_12915 [Leeuwenhoekiella sp.]
MRFQRLLIEGKLGTLTCFVSNSRNDFFGLSAFHVLRGNDNRVDDEEIIKILNHTGRWVNFGKTKYGEYNTGQGQYGNFGKLDYGIFELHPSFKRRISNRLTPLMTSSLFQFDNLEHILGTRVQAYSEENQNWIYGEIVDIHHKFNSTKLFDVLIRMDLGTRTYEGDSGMLWRDEYGDALFMHTNRHNVSGFHYSYGTIISRIITPNNLTLIQVNEKLFA